MDIIYVKYKKSQIHFATIELVQRWLLATCNVILAGIIKSLSSYRAQNYILRRRQTSIAIAHLLNLIEEGGNTGISK